MSRRPSKKSDASLSRDKKRNKLILYVIAISCVSLIAIIALLQAFVFLNHENNKAGEGAGAVTMAAIGKIIQEGAKNINEAYKKFLMGEEKEETREHSRPWEKSSKKFPPIGAVSNLWLIAVKPALLFVETIASAEVNKPDMI